MVALNSKGEVADFLDVSQFINMLSAYMCVSFAGALIKHAGTAGHGPSGTVSQAIADGTYWYAKLEGSDAASNKNGMSLSAEYTMLQGLGLHFWGLSPSVDAIHGAIAQGVPVLLCGAETGMVDMELGDRVPYNWSPSGNHCVVISGVTHDGNLLVHDTANVDAQGHIRSGPRVYDASKMQIVSVTAVQIGEDMITPLSISMPAVAAMFEQLDATHWKDRATGRILQDAHLADYKANGAVSLERLGHMISPERYLGDDVIVNFEFGVRAWNKTTGKVRSLALYDGGTGTDPAVAKLQAQLTAAQAQPAMPQEHALLQQFVEQAKALGIS